MADIFDRFPAFGRLGKRRRRHVPFVQQLADTECGIACLAMILGHHGREVSLEHLREVCGASRDGVNARDLLETANGFGLRGRGVRLEPGDLSLVPPGSTILHWEFKHFVVLTAVRSAGIEILDPQSGPRSISLEEVRRSFTGIALVLEPTDLFVRQKRRSPFFHALKELALASGLLRRLVAISLVLQLFGLALPILTGQIIDRVLPRADLSLFNVMMIAMVIVLVFRTVGEIVRGHLLLHLRTLLDARLTTGFLDHLVSLPHAFFQARNAGDLLMRLNSNSVVREQLTSTAMSGALDGIMVLAYLLILVAGSWTMTVVALLTGALDISLFLLARRRQRDLTAKALQTSSTAQSYEVEMLTAMETLKACGSEQRAVSHWSNLFVDQLNAKIDCERLTIKTDACFSAIRLAGPIAIMGVGAHAVLNGSLSLGAMLGLAAVAAGFLQPLSSLVHTLLALETARGYLDRVNDVLDARPEVPADGSRTAKRLTGTMQVENVSFRYGTHGALVVRDASFEVKPGQFVAIVGRSGSGKTTLANLILGLQTPNAGRLLFDGTDLRALDLRAVRRQFGVVNQNLSLFGTSIRDNISMGDPGTALAAIERAARLACVHDDIMSFPLGYDTPLLDRGGSVSGGQKQRIALARALVHQPAILLMDEATSALDAATERDVQRSLEQLACTRIVIAHRLSTVRRADLILVLDQGRIVEADSHSNLLAARGVYASLVAAQLDATPPQAGSPLLAATVA